MPDPGCEGKKEPGAEVSRGRDSNQNGGPPGDPTIVDSQHQDNDHPPNTPDRVGNSLVVDRASGGSLVSGPEGPFETTIDVEAHEHESHVAHPRVSDLEFFASPIVPQLNHLMMAKAMGQVTKWEGGMMKRHYHMTKGECLAELETFDCVVTNPKDYTLQEVRVLVRENRVRAGLVKDKSSEEEDMIKTVNNANLTDLKAMCIARGMKIPEKARVGELRLCLKQWLVQSGTGQTVYKLGGRVNGMTFQEIALSDPAYLLWAKKETTEKGANSHWQLRQLVHWAERMDRDESATTIIQVQRPDLDEFASPMKKTQGGYQTTAASPPGSAAKHPEVKQEPETTQAASSGEVTTMIQTMKELASVVGVLQQNVAELQEKDKPRKARSTTSSAGFEKVEKMGEDL